MAHRLVGIDEVGRGCWAGPLVAAAVILPLDFNLENGPLDGKLTLRDSKKLSRSQRDKLAKIVEKSAIAIGIGWVWPDAIDKRGLTAAVQQAMTDAMRQVKVPYDEVIIDGNINYLAKSSFCKDGSCKEVRTEVGADDTYPAVSAASIVAKVARDNYMLDMGLKYPGYGFDSHVGYGTARHIEALKQFGITDIHRRSFKPIKELLVES